MMVMMVMMMMMIVMMDIDDSFEHMFANPLANDS